MSPASPTVTRLALTPVKGTRLQTVPRIELEPDGALGDRAFYVVDAQGRMRNGKQLGELQQVSAAYELASSRLSLQFPDGQVVSGHVEYGEPINTRFFSADVAARPVVGPWSEALSDFLGQPVRIVASDDRKALDRGAGGAASLISQASLDRLAQAAQAASVDPRRFRMLIEINGVEAHAEDGWLGRRVRAGDAVIEPRGHVGRCLITSRDPETGEIDLPTLDVLGGYRRGVASTEPLPFGVYGRVVEAGPVSVGDPVTVEG